MNVAEKSVKVFSTQTADEPVNVELLTRMRDIGTEGFGQYEVCRAKPFRDRNFRMIARTRLLLTDPRFLRKFLHLLPIGAVFESTSLKKPRVSH